MAGIITDVSSDVRKMQELKKAIEGVKSSLKSINVKVDIDIAKGMEEQLTYLTKQYDALVSKIAEGEGKIMASVNRINNTVNKITAAQNAVSEANNAARKSGMKAGETAKVNASETQSVSEQAKAYEELKNDIDAILGTRSENIKRMVDEMNAIRMINAEIAQINKLSSNGVSISSSQRARLEKLNNSLLTHKQALADIRIALSSNVKLDNAAETSMAALSQSLGRMRAAYRELTAEERNSPFGKELLASIQQADAEIKRLDATIGNHQRNVGDYSSRWNGLNMSIQQLGRELPSLAMGWNTFFLAISNNLPILADEIKRARTEFKQMKAEGKSAIPVWKQVATSLVSWQTALTVGITLLTLYGKEIMEWVGSLFKAKKALSETFEASEEFNKSVADKSAEQITLLNKMAKEWQSLGGDIKKQEKYVRDNKEAFDTLNVSVNNVLDAENLLVGNKEAFIESVKAKAKAAAAMDIAAEEYKKSMEKMREAEAMPDKVKAFIPSYTHTSTFGGMQTYGTYEYIENKARTDAIAAANGMEASADAIIDKAIAFEEEASKKLKKANIRTNTELIEGSVAAIEAVIRQKQEALKDVTNRSDYAKIEAEIKAHQAKLDAITGGNKAENKQQVNERERLYKELADLQKKNQEDEIELMQEGAEKRMAQINFQYAEEIEAIEKLRDKLKSAQGGMLTEEQSIVFDNAISNAGKKRSQSFDVKAYIENMRQGWQQYFIEYGTYQEKRKYLIQKYDDEIDKLSVGSPEYATKVAEKNKALESLDEQYGKSTKAMADLFEDASNKSVASIQAIIDKYENLVSYLSGGGDVSISKLKELGFTDADIKKIVSGETSIKDITDAIKDLKGELNGRSPFMTFSDSLENAFEKFKKGKDGSPAKIAEGIGDIGRAVVEFTPALKQFGSDIGNIFGFDDSKVQGAIDAVGGLGQTAAGVGQMFSGDIVGGAMAAVNGISQVVSALDGMFGADYAQYNRMAEEYNALEKVWDMIISKKQEYIDISYGDEARKTAKEVLDVLNRQTESLVALGIERLNSGSSAGSHSIGVRQRKNMTDKAWAELRNASRDIGFNYGSVADGRMEGLFNLTANQLEELQAQAPTFWAKLDEDVQEYLQKIIDCGDELEEMKKKMQETMTGVSFDSFYDNFVSTLTDMDKSSQDFADDFGRYLQTAILSNLLANKYRGRIEELYNQWANKSDSDGNSIFDLTAEEAQQLKEAQKALADEMIAERDAMADVFGWTSSVAQQEASSKGFQTMSQDTGNELNGRFAALQVATEATMNIADEIRDIQAASYLELVQISENTGAIIKPIQQIQRDIADVKRNTSNM